MSCPHHPPLIPFIAALFLTFPVTAQPQLFEAEDFQVSIPGWQPKPWGTNYYAATFANTFLSRKAYLGAPEQCARTEAKLEITIPAPGQYLALVRYEAAYRFETQFRLHITQAGKTKLDRLYGARDNLKIWAFKEGLKREVAWSWGAVENIVWEGHDAAVDLEAGLATLTLIADKQPEGAPAACRNIDLVMLSPDHKDVEQRIAKEGYLPLDGLLTQSGDLYARIHNPGPAPATVTFPHGTEHSPYWVHHRTWKPRQLTAAPTQTTDWSEVGHLLDTLNDGQWRINIKSNIPITLEFGLLESGRITPIRKFENLTGETELAYDANTRKTRRIRLAEETLYELVADLKNRPITGTPPKRTLVYGYTFPARPNNAKYSAALNEFLQLMGATALTAGSVGGTGKPAALAGGLPAGYIDLRDLPIEKLEDRCRKLVEEGRAQDIAVVSLGDEIHLPKPQPNPETQEAFQHWLKSSNLDTANLHFSPSDKSNPERFYYSQLFIHHHGIQSLKQRTGIIKKHLPHAGIGANFSPHGAGYLGETHHWITVFREGGLTMPWGEDYIWQVPVGSQQMSALMLDMFRAGLANSKDPNAKIHWYVMPHWPGNTPNSWRRQFYTAVGHGAKVFNLFEFRPVQFAYTENHVSSPDMFQAVRVAMHELGQFEDILQTGQVRPAQAALWFSQTADVWNDNQPPFAANKRTLYIALRHRQIPLDCVLEGDDLSKYKAIFLTDRHVSRAASQALIEWVESGGHLIATPGAGTRDEFARPNLPLRDLLGAPETNLDAADPIQWEKQDLPYARTTTLLDNRKPLTSRNVANGKTTYCPFLSGLAYFQPAIPKRPLDRGTTDDSMAHFIPTQFNSDVAGLLAQFALEAGTQRHLRTSHPLIDATIIDSSQGLAIPLINWQGHPLNDFTLTLNAPIKWKTATLATGAQLKQETRDNRPTFIFDLHIADVLILRP